MSLFACRYAVIQFLPYAETGEFANVGVVLLCPEARYFGFRLHPPRRTGRITRFFGHLDRSVFVRALTLFQQELQRVAAHLDTDVFPGADGDTARGVFAALTHPREAMIRFSPVRAIMTSSPSTELDTLFGRYVEHVFSGPKAPQESARKADQPVAV